MNNSLKNGTYWSLTLTAFAGALVVSIIKWVTFVFAGTIFAKGDGAVNTIDAVSLFTLLLIICPIIAGLITDFIENKEIRIGRKTITSIHVLLAGLIIALAGICIEIFAGTNEGKFVVAAVVVAIGASLFQVNITGLTGRMFKEGKSLPVFFVQDLFVSLAVLLAGSTYGPALYSGRETTAIFSAAIITVISIIFTIISKKKLHLYLYDARTAIKEEAKCKTSHNALAVLLFSIIAFAIVRIADMTTFIATTSMVNDFSDSLVVNWPKNPVFIVAAATAAFGVTFALVSMKNKKIKPKTFLFIAAFAEAITLACTFIAVKSGNAGTIVPATYFLATGIVYATTRPALKSFATSYAPEKFYTTFCALPHIIDYIGVSITTAIWLRLGGYSGTSLDCLTYLIAALVVAILILLSGFFPKRKDPEAE